MKKAIKWARIIATILFVIVWLIIGLKLLDNNYDFLTEVYVAFACFVIILVCSLCRLFTNKCPYCGKQLYSSGRYCPHCGKSVE